MGLYDINLKRTVIGYQFDHNVYIGNQTNENRVVTFKELGNVINSVSGGGSGSVTSIALTAPTGFTVSGSPVTGAGTLALSFDDGYSLPTIAKQAEWDSKAAGDHTHANMAVTNANNNFSTTQTIVGSDDTPLNLQATHASWSNIAFFNNTGTRLGNIGFNNKAPYYWGGNGDTGYLASQSWVENAGHVFSNSISFSGSPTITKHLVVYGDDEADTDKPSNNTGITGDLDTKYWNTGISTYDADSEVGYQYSFPAHSGTFVTTAGGTMDNDAVIGFKSANDNDTAHIDSDGFTAATRTGTTSSNWSSTTTSYAYDAINIEKKGKRTGPNHQVIEWDNVYKLNLPLKGQIVESGDTGATLLTDESLKTINGQSLVGSGNIVIGEDETERTFSTHGSAQFFKTFNLHITNSDYAYDSSHASDIDILDAFSENIEHFGLAICRFGNTRTLNPMKNGGQQRKGWFIEPNICKRGRCNITGFSQNDDAYVTSYSLQDLIEFVFDGMKYKSGDSLINLMPTLSLLLKSKTYRSKTYDSLKKGYADAQELVFEIENTSTIDVPIKPSIARATSNYLTFDSNKLSLTTQIGTGGFLYNKVVASVKFNLLIGEWGSIYIDTSSNSSFHGYHPRCMWTDAMKTFIALKTPSTSGKNWRLIIQFASAK